MSSDVGHSDPLYLRSVFPDVFKIQAKELKINTEQANVPSYTRKQKLDHKVVEEKLNEIESLINYNNQEILNTIKSTIKTESFLSPFEECNKNEEISVLQKKTCSSFI